MARQQISLTRRLVAETAGTFFLTFVESGGAMIGSMPASVVSSSGRAAAAGLTVMALIYTIGPSRERTSTPP
jgi:glycerol uptake facilitator-like aquaporin